MGISGFKVFKTQQLPSNLKTWTPKSSTHVLLLQITEKSIDYRKADWY